MQLFLFLGLRSEGKGSLPEPRTGISGWKGHTERSSDLLRDSQPQAFPQEEARGVHNLFLPQISRQGTSLVKTKWTSAGEGASWGKSGRSRRADPKYSAQPAYLDSGGISASEECTEIHSHTGLVNCSSGALEGLFPGSTWEFFENKACQKVTPGLGHPLWKFKVNQQRKLECYLPSI